MTKRWTDPVPARMQIWLPEFNADHELTRVNSIEARGFMREFRVERDVVEMHVGDFRHFEPGEKDMTMSMHGENGWNWRFVNHKGRRVAIAERKP